MNNEMPEMITLQEAANRFKNKNIPIGYGLLRRLCFEGKLKCVRLGRYYLLNWSELMKGFESGGVTIK